MFQKENFSNILKKILMNYDSIQDFANHVEMDRGYLSRNINMKLENPPTPKILKRIADNSKGITTYEELMSVCGYMENIINPFKENLDDNIFYSYMTSFALLSSTERKYIIEYINYICNKETFDLNKITSELNKLVLTKKINTKQKDNILNNLKILFTILKEQNNKKIFKINNMKKKDNSVQIPVLGSVPAGIPIELIEDIIDYEDISEEMLKGDKEYFALKVKGTSMWPKYLDGDTIIVLKQNDCESGQDAIVMVNGDDGTFKRVIKKDTGITLEPINQQEYNSVSYSNEDIEKLPIRILGVVKEIRRKI